MEEVVIETLIDRLLKEIPKLPHTEEIGKLFRNIIILTGEQPHIGKEALDHFAEYIDDLKESYSTDPLLLSKGQYIAIVGDSYVDERAVIAMFAEFGVTKSNIKFYTDFNKYKSGEYSESLLSKQCVAVILGPVAHSARNINEKDFSGKLFHARAKAGKLKLTKESLRELIPEVINYLKMNTN